LFRKIALLGGTAALVAGSMFIGVGAHAAAPPIDATNYTVSCDTITGGVVGFKPALLLGGSTPSAASIKGTLSGCSATPAGGGDPVTVVSGSVKGTLNTSTNDCLSLLGPSSATGTITITWKVGTGQKLTNNKTVITVSNGNVSGGTSNPFSDSATYGLFNISGTSQTGAFGGASGTGAASFTNALTVQGVGALTPQCTSPSKGLKGITLGSGEVNLG
jgi:hypothetical protein